MTKSGIQLKLFNKNRWSLPPQSLPKVKKSIEATRSFSDFEQTFDVDYGNCYTFNHATPVKYTTKRTGSRYGKLKLGRASCFVKLSVTTRAV